VCYAQGLGGLQRDLNLARRWFQRAADAGDSNGLYNVAMAYVQDPAVSGVSLEEARAMCKEAIGHGHSQAQDLLSRLESGACLDVPRVPAVILHSSQRHRLQNLLSELGDMKARGGSLADAASELADILGKLKAASQDSSLSSVVDLPSHTGKQ